MASSSGSKQSIVAIKAINPAIRACTKVSFRLLVNAGTSTLRFVVEERLGAMRPSRIHVFVRMDASASI